MKLIVFRQNGFLIFNYIIAFELTDKKCELYENRNLRLN
jgi:hypothetical protein